MQEIKDIIVALSGDEKYKATLVDPTSSSVTQQGVDSVLAQFDSMPNRLWPMKGNSSGAGEILAHQWIGQNRLHCLENCTNFRREIIDYRFEDWADALAATKNKKEKPRDFNNHTMDCLKMFANYVAYDEVHFQRRTEPIKDKPEPGSLRWYIERDKQRGRFMGQRGIIRHAFR